MLTLRPNTLAFSARMEVGREALQLAGLKLVGFLESTPASNGSLRLELECFKLVLLDFHVGLQSNATDAFQSLGKAGDRRFLKKELQ